MGGIEFLRELRATDSIKHISVFVMTTSNEEQDKVNAYKLNVAGYILKPLSIESFISSVAMLNNYWMLCEYPD
jgi:CheY-like chemotaxis protein